MQDRLGGISNGVLLRGKENWIPISGKSINLSKDELQMSICLYFVVLKYFYPNIMVSTFFDKYSKDIC